MLTVHDDLVRLGLDRPQERVYRAVVAAAVVPLRGGEQQVALLPPPPPPPPQESLFASQEKFFQELFEGELASQATAEFEKAMRELAEEEPHLVEQFQKLSEAAGRVGGDAVSQQEFTSCLKETLSGLAKNATDLQGSAASDEELAKAIEGLGLEEGGGEGGVLPVMQSLLQHLLSKEVLYPSLKEITEKVRGAPGGFGGGGD
uniref:Peroxisomal biogenesis factor 19 n=1 Tax=Anser cygnoides TaxID=8845 RepID=A0A8B9ELE8_ANSCY